MTPEEAKSFDDCIAGGGVALFPSDTVYGLATDPESEDGVRRLYELKGRPPDRPAAVMFFDLDRALAELASVGERTSAAMHGLLPGQVTLLLPNPERRYPLACGPEPERLGLRVPALAGPSVAVLQSSANHSGGADARRLDDVPAALRAGVDLEIDGGELAGTPSTVVDLTRYETEGEHTIVREGAVPAAEVAAAL